MWGYQESVKAATEVATKLMTSCAKKIRMLTGREPHVVVFVTVESDAEGMAHEFLVSSTLTQEQLVSVINLLTQAVQRGASP